MRDPSREYYEQLRRPSTRRTVKTTSAQAEYDALDMALEAHKRVHQLENSLLHVDSLGTLSPGPSGYTPNTPIPLIPPVLSLPSPRRTHDECPLTVMASLIRFYPLIASLMRSDGLPHQVPPPLLRAHARADRRALRTPPAAWSLPGENPTGCHRAC